MPKQSFVPDWAKGIIWYQILPERFCNGDKANDPGPRTLETAAPPGWKTSPWTGDWYKSAPWEGKSFSGFFSTVTQRRYGGDLQGIIDRMGHIKKLGAQALYLNPVFRSPSHHKYDGSSFHHIDETLGPDPVGDRKLIASETDDPATWRWTAADRLFLELLSKAHALGLRVIMDGVFNHCGRDFFAFSDLREKGRLSRYKNWFRGLRWNDSAPDGFYYRGWWGLSSMPEFARGQTFNEGYKRYLFNITSRWLAPDGKPYRGADGFRLDVAECVPHGFWQEWRKHVRALKPDAYLTAEVDSISPAFVRGDEFDAMMNYPFAFSCAAFFNAGENALTAAAFDNKLAEVRAAYAPQVTQVMQNLISSHDTPRLRSIILNHAVTMNGFADFHRKSKLECNPSYKTGRGGEKERKLHILAAAFQALYIGAPMIYYGDEYGMTGANDPDCRKPMLWPDMKYENESLRPGPGSEKEPNRPDLLLFESYREFLSARKKSPAITRGSYKTLLAEKDGRLLVFERKLGEETVVCVFNASSQSRTVLLPAKGVKKPRLLAGAASCSVEKGKLRVQISALSAAAVRV